MTKFLTTPRKSCSRIRWIFRTARGKQKWCDMCTLSHLAKKEKLSKQLLSRKRFKGTLLKISSKCSLRKSNWCIRRSKLWSKRGWKRIRYTKRVWTISSRVTSQIWRKTLGGTQRKTQTAISVYAREPKTKLKRINKCMFAMVAAAINTYSGATALSSRITSTIR